MIELEDLAKRFNTSLHEVKKIEYMIADKVYKDYSIRKAMAFHPEKIEKEVMIKTYLYLRNIEREMLNE